MSLSVTFSVWLKSVHLKLHSNEFIEDFTDTFMFGKDFNCYSIITTKTYFETDKSST